MCAVSGGELRAGDDACKVELVRRRDLKKLAITEGTMAVIELRRPPQAFEKALGERGSDWRKGSFGAHEKTASQGRGSGLGIGR
jgi:hypothetical protein